MTDDIYSKRSRRKRRKQNNRDSIEISKNFIIIAAVIVILIITGLYFTRNRWLPELEKLGIYIGYSNNAQIDENGVLANNGELAGGNFPLMLSDSSDYQTAVMNERLVILSDSDFEIYSSAGELIRSRTHTYSNVILKTSAGRSLIYESGGNKLSVETEKKTVFEKQLDDRIIFARISKEGYTAVVTTSDNYASMLTVYDDVGNPVYYRDSVDRIIEICFNNDSTGCMVTIMSADSGKIISNAYEVIFTQEQPLWTTSENIETLCISSYATTDDGMFIIGDKKCGYYDSGGVFLKGYTYKYSIIMGGFSNDKSAIAFNNEKRRRVSLVLTSGVESDPVEIVVDRNLKYLVAESEYVYIMTDNEIIAYDYTGKEAAKAEISDIYNSFLKSGDIIYLIGNNHIDKINFISS